MVVTTTNSFSSFSSINCIKNISRSINMTDSTLLSSIKQQIEFYFDDSNFRKDAFLRTAAKEDPEGFVPISVLLTFNKLNKLTKDENIIKDAIKSSDIVVINDDGKSIKRAKPLPEDDNTKVRTLYVKGYPIDDADVTIDSVSQQFSEYGKVLMVRFRKDLSTKKFKGSCFVEYDNEESVKKAVAIANDGGKMNLSYKEQPFACVMTLVEWVEKKHAKKLRLAVERKKREREGGDKEGSNKKQKTDNAEEKKIVEKKVEYTKGLLIKVTNIPEETDIYKVKDKMKEFGDIKFVDKDDKATFAFVRTANTDTTDAIIKAVEGGITLEGDSNKLEAVLIDGDEEEQYWTKIAASSKGGKGKGGKGKGGKGGRGGGRGGRGGGRGGRGGRGRKQRF